MSRPASRISSGGGTALVGLLLVVGLTACGAASDDSLADYAAGPTGAVAEPVAPESSGSDSDAPVAPAFLELAGTEPAPVRLADVTDDGFLAVPEDIEELGYWVGSAPMGSGVGTTLIAGHVDSAVAGLGVFAALADLTEGDEVAVTDGLGVEHRFVVDSKLEVNKAELPADVFDTEGERRLVLITCGGPFDKSTGNYRDNLIVSALPV